MDFKRPEHHTEDGFTNYYLPSGRGIADVLKWKLGFGPKENAVPLEAVPFNPKIVKPDLKQIRKPDQDHFQITWIGHSTFLIQVNGINILTDPIFGDIEIIPGVPLIERLTPAGLKFEDLPHIDLVLISHNHYDHLDAGTIAKFGNNTTFVVPLKLGNFLRDMNKTRIVELDWWEQAKDEGIIIHSIPSRHYSSRYYFDMFKSLWCGYIIEAKGKKIAFIGDTAYSPVFKDIHERHGIIDFAMIPIGAYRPRWFMKVSHIVPTESVRVHKDLGAKMSAAMHWGTFQLSDEPPGEPPVFLKKAMEMHNISEDEFRVMAFGETIEIVD